MSAFTFTLLLAAEAYPVGSGKIQGGWEYIWAAYLITFAALTLYSLSLWLRRREERAPAERPEEPKLAGELMSPGVKREVS